MKKNFNFKNEFSNHSELTHLKHKSTGNHLLLLNTHLFWHPRGANIRMMQMAVISRIVKREKDRLEKEFGKKFAVVFGGDFNSVPSAAAVRYLLGETIRPNDIGWSLKRRHSGGQVRQISARTEMGPQPKSRAQSDQAS